LYLNFFAIRFGSFNDCNIIKIISQIIFNLVMYFPGGSDVPPGWGNLRLAGPPWAGNIPLDREKIKVKCLAGKLFRALIPGGKNPV
jgi:hypothetical protein